MRTELMKVDVYTPLNFAIDVYIRSLNEIPYEANNLLQFVSLNQMGNGRTVIYRL